MEITSFEEVNSWKQARRLTNEIYNLTKNQSFFKDFGLRDQIQRASISTMANIAEGFDGRTDRQFSSFLGYAYRSATEVQSHLYVALDQGYIDEEMFKKAYESAEETKRLINGFLQYLDDDKDVR